MRIERVGEERRGGVLNLREPTDLKGLKEISSIMWGGKKSDIARVQTVVSFQEGRIITESDSHWQRGTPEVRNLHLALGGGKVVVEG